VTASYTVAIYLFNVQNKEIKEKQIKRKEKENINV